jgi:segregation and condensation protein B
MASLAEKRVAEPEEDPVDPNRVDSSQADTSLVAPSWIAPSQIGTSQIGTSQIGTSQVAPIQASTPSKAGSNPADLGQANPSEANPSEANPSLEDSSLEDSTPVDSNVAEPTPAEANRVEPNAVEPNAVEPSLVEPSLVEPSLVEPSLVEPSLAEPHARPEELRLLEALLFAASEPLDQAALAKRMPDGVDIKVALAQLQADYSSRGVNLVRVANKWTFRTAGDLSWLMTKEITETRRLSRAAIEVLSIIAYHQPVTRAEIEEIRGVVTSKGTLDVLLETGWIKPRGRRKTPGRPLTFGTTETFLSQFSLEALGDLPGLEELKGTGLLDSRLPTGFTVPNPSDDPTLREDEEPLEAGELELTLAPPVEPEGEGES